MNDIIVGIDRTDTARRAADTAAGLAAAYDTNLHVVMCVDTRASVNVAVGSDRFHIDWLNEADDFLRNIARQLDHDQITTTVGRGDPAKVLCEEAERLNARTIVVGNRRAQGVARVLGSVAANVTKTAPCDVLVANTTQ